MPLASPEMKTELTTRLRRIEGQVRVLSAWCRKIASARKSCNR